MIVVSEIGNSILSLGGLLSLSLFKLNMLSKIIISRLDSRRIEALGRLVNEFLSAYHEVVVLALLQGPDDVVPRVRARVPLRHLGETLLIRIWPR